MLWPNDSSPNDIWPNDFTPYDIMPNDVWTNQAKDVSVKTELNFKELFFIGGNLGKMKTVEKFSFSRTFRWK